MDKRLELVCMKIKFLHAADLHLGRVFTGLRQLPEQIYDRVVDSGFRALEKLVSAAIEHDVDFVLFAGDVFDSNAVSLRTYLRLRKQLERLERHQIRAFICHGNHDPLVGGQRVIDWPKNVTVFPDETVTAVPYKTKRDQVAMIYGFSYTRREIVTDKSKEYTKKTEGDFHLAMLHGNVDGQTEHDPYAPFTVNGLLAKQFDYWALGHIHKRQILATEPPIIYPGNIQGMHRNEQGEKGCMLVTLSKAGPPEIVFIPTSEIIWHEIEIEITNVNTVDSLLDNIQSMKEQFRKQNTLLHIQFTGSGILNEQLRSANELDDLLWAVNEGEEEQQPFIWVVGVSVHTLGDWNREELEGRGDFIGELISSINTYSDFDEALALLFNNRNARMFLQSFSGEEREAILEKAESLLLTKLMKEHSK